MAGRGASERGAWWEFRARGFWLGLLLALLVGLAYAYGWWLTVVSVLTDCYQPSPGMAALAPLVLGGVLAPLVVPSVLVIVYVLVPRRSGVGWLHGYLPMLIVAGAAVIAGFLMLDANVPVPAQTDRCGYYGEIDRSECHPLLLGC